MTPIGNRVRAILRNSAVGLIKGSYETDSDAYEVPEGDEERKVYVYDGRPLKGTRMGEKFRMQVVHGTIDLTSIYTGHRASDYIDSLDNLCLAYQGKPAGYFSGTPRTLFQELSDLHPNMTIMVRHDGINPGGWPILTALIPEYEWFKSQGLTGNRYKRH